MIYRDVLPLKRTDLCEEVEHPRTAHPIVKQVFDLMKAEYPKSVHSCPYSV